MAVKTGELEAELIDTVCERVRERLGADQVVSCEPFVRQYYHWVPAEDLVDRSALDLYGAAVAHWNLAQQRMRGEVKLHVYNPDFEQNGWSSPHTVIEVVSDDMPFLVDSVTLELAKHGYGTHLVIHPVIRVRRDDSGNLLAVADPAACPADASAESIIHIELDREPNREQLVTLRDHVERVMGEVRAAVDDWGAMRGRAEALIEELASEHVRIGARDLDEAQSFLQWLTENHFTFLGYRDYTLIVNDGPARLEPNPESGLGILRGTPRTPVTELSEQALELALAPAPLVLTKANSRSTVHRPAYLDYVGVKRYGPDGEVIGERRFLGLYTTAAYKESPDQIPLLRGKVRYVMDTAGFPSDSHDAKALTEILESYPRDSLFQIDREELFRISMGILGLGERQRIRLFMRRDALNRFVACIVCMPRDRFNTENRERAGEILQAALNGSHYDWSVQLSDSLLARIHYIVHCPDGVPEGYDVAEIEGKIVRSTRAWSDDLRAALLDELGEEQGLQLLRRYAAAFPPAYRGDWLARSAVTDIARLEELAVHHEPIICLYRPLEAEEGQLRCKLFSETPISLSDVLPTFEHMGARVVDEHPYEVTLADREPVWIYDFGLRCVIEDAEQVRDLFQDAFLGVWRGELEDDGLNGLVLLAELTGREVTLVRAIAKYLRQAGIPFSDSYMERTLLGHPEITTLLVRLFYSRLDPERRDEKLADELATAISNAIDAVVSLDEDRILRSFLSVIVAILRTNYFTVDAGGEAKPYLSFKLDPAQVPILPLPRPRFEIFVYSPRVEGVHLRGGKVARGGLRWSDRREDFRTEILGLMKAQMVKNALIVPVGSKGGFVLKRPPAEGGREALQEEGIACYTTFLCGLLDLTDNIVGGDVVPPEHVVRYDDDDPYLVVAADKGTATFSDIANGVSADYGFWLGDAFASGGSQGYDHKAMGITARGAWESVKRHFRELGTDIQTTDFTVVGVGDMAGDVFGNGMLLSPHIKLLGAFNHMHVFIDPNPDPAASHAERKRLFELPRSAWSDYNTALISAGGGVFERTAKSIPISPEAKEALGLEADELTPTELIRALLCAPVDLLWNGGIGTYVKSSEESHADAGDKANDAVRINGSDLRCKVVGEGGNLGLTQRGRIEYALAGGQINTDAIDNVAGVNCSDHEVNIKILLGALVASGDMTDKQRNELLVQMTDEVAAKVIYGSYTQTQAMSLAMHQAAPMVDVHERLIRHLEQVAGLNREIEYLPTEQVIADRKVAKQGLMAPEMAVVMAYCKIHLFRELLESDLPEDSHLELDLERYFPPPLPERYSAEMRGHRLRREIIATVVANQLVDRAGTTFAFRLGEETGAPASALARAYAVAREVFDMRSYWAAVEALDNQIDAGTQLRMLIEARRLVERATRWLLSSNQGRIDIALTARYFAPGAKMLAAAIPEILDDSDREAFDQRAAELVSAGVPNELALRTASLPSMLAVFDIIEVAGATGRDPQVVMETIFQIGSSLQLTWLRERIIELPRNNRWQALARAALRDDLNSLVRVLGQEVLDAGGPTATSAEAIELWLGENAAGVERCLTMLADIHGSRIYDTTTLPVALREIRNLIRGGGLVGPSGQVGAESFTHAG